MIAATFQQLYYITHIDNLRSIFRDGILSHQRIQEEGIEFTPIYDVNIVSNRAGIKTPAGRSLWEYANVYFQPRNAMLFRVAREKPVDEICVLGVRPDLVNDQDAFITTGNAASGQSEFLPHKKGVRSIPRILKNVDKKWWSDLDGSKREMMAECLIPDRISPEAITMVYVATEEAFRQVRAKVPSNISVTREPDMFFEPARIIQIDPLLHLAEGDLFFSGMQTLTISVNVVGVMGKGLASTAKYRFPDVYVKYQDVCRNGSLRMGKPYLVKRETSFDQQLADDPSSFSNGTPETWFLLFATKQHWREQADLRGIEQGLHWLNDTRNKNEIRSLALPALGCGLGNLNWSDVGPLMCKYLRGMGIPIRIYLPTERPVPPEQLTKEFLLGRPDGRQTSIATPR